MTVERASATYEQSAAEGMIEAVVAVARMAVGAAAIADALRGLNRAIAVRPHRNWAVGAMTCQILGGCLMLVGLGGPIGPGAVAEVLLVVAVVSSAPPGYWEVSGRLGYFPALRAMSQLAREPARWPIAAAAIELALLGNGAPSLDGTLGIELPNLVTSGWFAFLILSALLVLIVRVYQGRS